MVLTNYCVLKFNLNIIYRDTFGHFISPIRDIYTLSQKGLHEVN